MADLLLSILYPKQLKLLKARPMFSRYSGQNYTSSALTCFAWELTNLPFASLLFRAVIYQLEQMIRIPALLLTV